MDNYTQMIDVLTGSALCGVLVLTFAGPFAVWFLWRLSLWAANKITQHILGE